MVKLGGRKWIGALVALCAAASIASQAQTFNNLGNFYRADANPASSLVQGLDGKFYGTTAVGDQGCLNGCGTVFKITPGGRITTLYSFCALSNCADGIDPNSVVLGTDGNFYGTTYLGGSGSNNLGTVFKITSKGTLTTLYSFCAQPNCVDGSAPLAGLIQGSDGSLYGTTINGGANVSSCIVFQAGGCGTVFKITPGGKLTTLYSFCAQEFCSDGTTPTASLIQATDGNFYGTTSYGSGCPGYGCGSVFRITPGGSLSTIYRFCTGYPDCSDGANPSSALVQGADGNLYGVTPRGGDRGEDGTVFRITPEGKLTTLYDFCSQSDCADGGHPTGLSAGTDGNFYGTTADGGNITRSCPSGCGTVFSITPSGALSTLHSFDGADGSDPYGGLLQGTDGVFYGVTAEGGRNASARCGFFDTGCGTVYSLSTALDPFVAFVRPYGKVGQTGGILGQGFTGTTSVSLNGIPASFAVVSDTLIKATVPPGATTGFVTVVTPSGTLTSNVPFRVIQ